MTKKDYMLIAGKLASLPKHERYTIADIAVILSEVLISDNPRFSTKKWAKAIGLYL